MARDQPSIQQNAMRPTRVSPAGPRPQCQSLSPKNPRETQQPPQTSDASPSRGGGITGSAISYLSLPLVGGRSALTFPAEAEAFSNHDARAKKVMDLQHKLQSV